MTDKPQTPDLTITRLTTTVVLFCPALPQSKASAWDKTGITDIKARGF
jgi:hypothetical protein